MARYAVEGGALGRLLEGQDRSAYRELWSEYASIAPPATRRLLVEFDLFEPLDDTTGYVSRAAGGGVVLAIGVGDTNPIDRVDTMVHESMHVISLAASQIDQGVPEVRCPLYFERDYGCPRAGSILDGWERRFWLGPLLEEWRKRTREGQIDRFYREHQTLFVREYAATSPDEDIAETFAAWVLDRPRLSSAVRAKEGYLQTRPELIEFKAYSRSHGPSEVFKA